MDQVGLGPTEDGPSQAEKTRSLYSWWFAGCRVWLPWDAHCLSGFRRMTLIFQLWNSRKFWENWRRDLEMG